MAIRREAMSAWEGLADRIERKIKNIPAHNPAYVSAVPLTLGKILDARVLRKIAEEAANEAALTNLESTVQSYGLPSLISIFTARRR